MIGDSSFSMAGSIACFANLHRAAAKLDVLVAAKVGLLPPLKVENTLLACDGI